MRAYSLTHLRDDVLLHELTALLARDRGTTAALLARIAEVDQRRLYVPAGYPTRFAYCVDGLHLSEDAVRRGSAAHARAHPPPRHDRREHAREALPGAGVAEPRRSDGARRQKAAGGGDEPPPSRDDCVVRDRWRMMGAP